MFDYESVFKWAQWLWCWGRNGAQHAASPWGLTVRQSERIAAVIHCSFCWKIMKDLQMYECRWSNIPSLFFWTLPAVQNNLIKSRTMRQISEYQSVWASERTPSTETLRELPTSKVAEQKICKTRNFYTCSIWAIWGLPIYLSACLSVYLSWKKTCWLAPTLFQHFFCHHCKLAPFDLWLGFLLLTAKRNAAVPLSFSTIQCPEWKTNSTPYKTIK